MKTIEFCCHDSDTAVFDKIAQVVPQGACINASYYVAYDRRYVTVEVVSE